MRFKLKNLKKEMKKVIAILFVAGMASLAACTSKTESAADSTVAAVDSTATSVMDSSKATVDSVVAPVDTTKK